MQINHDSGIVTTVSLCLASYYAFHSNFHKYRKYTVMHKCLYKWCVVYFSIESGFNCCLACAGIEMYSEQCTMYMLSCEVLTFDEKRNAIEQFHTSSL